MIRMFSNIGFKGDPMKVAARLASRGSCLISMFCFVLCLIGIGAGTYEICFRMRKR